MAEPMQSIEELTDAEIEETDRSAMRSLPTCRRARSRWRTSFRWSMRLRG